MSRQTTVRPDSTIRSPADAGDGRHRRVQEDERRLFTRDRRCGPPRDACLIQDHISEVHVVGRYGGEKFALAFPGTDPANAARLADRLRKLVARHDWTHVVPKLTATLSIGLAGMSEWLPSRSSSASRTRSFMRPRRTVAIAWPSDRTTQRLQSRAPSPIRGRSGSSIALCIRDGPCRPRLIHPRSLDEYCATSNGIIPRRLPS